MLVGCNHRFYLGLLDFFLISFNTVMYSFINKQFKLAFNYLFIAEIVAW